MMANDMKYGKLAEEVRNLQKNIKKINIKNISPVQSIYPDPPMNFPIKN